MDVNERVGTQDELADRMIGVWWLLTREDFAEDGSRRVDPTLGADPLGILTYTPEHLAAQFMKRDRSEVPSPRAALSGQNNTAAVGGTTPTSDPARSTRRPVRSSIVREER